MSENPQSPGRFKPAMPCIPGVTQPSAQQDKSTTPGWKPSAGMGVLLAGALILGVVFAWWTLRAPRQAARTTVAAIETPPPEPTAPASTESFVADSVMQTPVVTPSGPGEVATLKELAKPWSAKQFFFRKRFTGETVPAMVIRLPAGAATRSASYWAFSRRAPFGRCELEYVTDLNKLATRHGYRARHPMVADPCTGAVYDPLRLGSLANGVWVRGEVVQGAGVRPPIAIDVRVRGNQIIATQIE